MHASQRRSGHGTAGHARWLVDAAIHETLAVARTRAAGPPFERLLAVVRARSALLAPGVVVARDGPAGLARVLGALRALAVHRREWVRPPEEWCPSDGPPADQFDAFVRHLLVTAPPGLVPRFLVRVWLEGESETAIRHRAVFRHVAGGFGIRGADIPIRLTKPMARHFTDAPDHVTVEQAVRWCQVRGMGGSESLANAIVGTHLGERFDNETFWTGVLRLLIDRDVDPAFAKRAIGFARWTPAAFEATRGRESVSNRRFDRLRHRIALWTDRHDRLRERLRRARLSWPATGIRSFRRKDEPGENPWGVHAWSITELRSSDDLRAEGDALRHCVASYARGCRAGWTSIWSLRRHGALRTERRLTIQVLPRIRFLVTALGYCNRRATEVERAVIRTWADREGIEIGRRV